MTHIAITEIVDGQGIDWLEALSQERYIRGTFAQLSPGVYRRIEPSS